MKKTLIKIALILIIVYLGYVVITAYYFYIVPLDVNCYGKVEGTGLVGYNNYLECIIEEIRFRNELTALWR